MLRFYHCSDLKPLGEQLLADYRRACGASPWQRPNLVVTDPAAGHWLGLLAAEQIGSAVDMSPRLPGEFIWRWIDRDARLDTPQLNPDRLRWLLLQCFEDLPDQPVLKPVQAYLAATAPAARFQFADTLARQYDHYLVYRPHWVLAWEQGSGSHWQAALWRHLTGRHELRHWAGALQALSVPEPANNTPSVLFLCTTPLTPSYLQALAVLAQGLDIRLYILNPSVEYWGDLRRQRALPTTIEAPASDEAFGLLANLGQDSRAFIEALLDRTDDARAIEAPANNGETLLSRLQHAIRSASSLPQAPAALQAEADSSLRVHSCHGPRRELEVVADQILDALENDDTLHPRDIAVLVPDLNRYAGAVHAVLGATVQGQRLPYQLHGEPAAGDQSAFAPELIEWLIGSMPLTGFSRLLESERLRGVLALDEPAADWLAQTLCELGVRWGLDAEMRHQQSGADSAAFSFAQAIDRVLLGFASGAVERPLIHDLAPVDDLSPDAVDLFGRLGAWLEQARLWRGRLRAERSPEDWVDSLRALTRQFFAPGWHGELSTWFRVLDALHEQSKGMTQPVAIELILEALQRAFDTQARQDGSGRGTGSIQIAQLGELRGLPFRLIAVLGLDAEQLPRQQPELEFDLLARHPKAGDPNRRQQDRGAFLDALMASKDRLCLSYCGASQRSGEPLPPSSLLNELFWDLDRRFVLRDGGAVSAAIRVRHPMQPFSPAYGRSAELFSYRAPMLAPAGQPPTAFLEGLATATDPGETALPLAQLIRWLQRPLDSWLGEQLAITTRSFHCQVKPDEPGREDFTNNQLIRAYLPVADSPPEPPWWTQRQGFADGLTGQAMLRRAQRLCAPLLAERQDTRPAQAFELGLDGWRLYGELDQLTDTGRQVLRGSFYASDWLALWVNHLAMCASGIAGPAPYSLAIAKPKGSRGAKAAVWHFSPVTDAGQQLTGLLELYRQGRRAPIAFYPASAMAWMQASLDDAEPQQAAWTAWSGGRFPEGAGGAYRLTGQQMAIDGEFERVARQVYAPLLAHRHEGPMHD